MSRARLLATAVVGVLVLLAPAGCARPVTIDQSSPERLVYTLLLANANGQDQDVRSVMTANGTTNPWAVDDPSEIVYCDDEGVACDDFPTQILSDGSCPSSTSDVEAVENDINVRYEPATGDPYPYGENMRATVRISSECAFDAFNVEGSWVVVGG